MPRYCWYLIVAAVLELAIFPEAEILSHMVEAPRLIPGIFLCMQFGASLTLYVVAFIESATDRKTKLPEKGDVHGSTNS